jgi:hypothetical protein
MAVKTKQKSNKFGLCIDWETSGVNWGGDSTKEYQGISFGAVVFDAETFEEVEGVHVYVAFDSAKYKWTKEAENIHGITIDFLLENGVSQEEAAAILAELILKYWGPDGVVMLLGHNTEFDRRFTNQLLNTIGIEFSIQRETSLEGWITLHHVILDTSAVGYVAFGLYKSDLLFEAVGCAERGKHNALQDARQALMVCKTVRELVNFSVSSIEG